MAVVTFIKGIIFITVGILVAIGAVTLCKEVALKNEIQKAASLA